MKFLTKELNGKTSNSFLIARLDYNTVFLKHNQHSLLLNENINKKRKR